MLAAMQPLADVIGLTRRLPGHIRAARASFRWPIAYGPLVLSAASTSLAASTTAFCLSEILSLKVVHIGLKPRSAALQSAVPTRANPGLCLSKVPASRNSKLPDVRLKFR